MPRKKKFEQSVALPQFQTAAGESFVGGLRALVHGLFGTKKPYRPSLRQVADYYLTPREREIAYLAALDFDDHAIADALGMNFQTVRVHLHNIYQKMQVEDARALREYFSEPPPKAH